MTIRPTVLLVDDDASVRAVVRRILPARLYEVLEADSLASALALSDAANRPIDLLLTDVVMPHGTGPALAMRLRAKWIGLRVLFMSGYGQEALARHGLTAGDGFVPKPFTPNTLREGVRRALHEASS